ncbi:tRNA pseudouridine synthase 1 [Frankliniella fusca]|uniref:tRNA pseudouridine synthase 1 n=1 Tax=Frankliniella fusca TaxID=407009 RepID=A0AAE1GVR7_9NEOP|nr:tRNA pseudouridine synthase 1 [Frankliniella fusca]
MIGDSLGQHVIGGFIQSFSSTYFCRFCEITREEFKSNPSLTKQERTLESYNRCVLRAGLLGRTYKGVKEGCELNSLKLLRATSHLVPCIAHDLFEGVVSWDLAGIIAYFVHKKKWFAYKLLNDRIKNFKCQLGIDRSNKPAFVRQDGEKLGGHAVQNWILVRLFFFLIGDKIQDLHDPGWQLYIQLKEMCELFCAPAFLKSDMPYLQDVLIPTYFEKRKVVLSEEEYPLKPKHHFMAHYPELMLRYGPLIHLWTLPFEQRHSFFKELMRKTRNFINPERSCAVRYQMSFCYATTSELFNEQFVEKKTKPLSSSSFTGDLSEYLSRQNLDHWFDCEVVSVGSTKYTKGEILLLASRSYSELEIGIIKVIATQENSLNFIVEERKAFYDKDLAVYGIELNSPGIYSTHEYSTLKYPVPQPLYIWREKSFLSLKFRLVQCDIGEDDL